MRTDSTFLLHERQIHPLSEDWLRIGAFQSHSRVLGPGNRAVLWVTGCNRRCPGCIQPEFLSFDAGKAIRVDELCERILSINDIEGLTISGGEPFEQAIPLAALSRKVHAHGLDVLAYSGFRLEHLEASREKYGPLLNQLDWLIEGEYRKDLGGPLKFKGSANQRMYKKIGSGQFKEIETSLIHDVHVELFNESIRLVGFPNQSFQQAFKESLRSRGLSLTAIDSTDKLEG